MNADKTIRIATAPVSWGIMEVEAWGRRQTYGQVLDEMVQAGYGGTELGPWGFLPTDARALKQELGTRGLALVGAFVPLPLASPERHDAGFEAALATARLLAEAGAPVIVLADEMNAARMAMAGRASEDDALADVSWEAAARLVTRVSHAARKLGLRAAFHHHAGTFVETPAEVDKLLALTDPDLVGLCLDTGHYYYGGGDPVEAARRHGKRTWHLHLKDIRREVLEAARREKIGFLEAVRRGVFCELGAGAVDLGGVIRELNAAGYDGWAVFEQDIDPSRPGARPVESAARSRVWLREKWGV